MKKTIFVLTAFAAVSVASQAQSISNTTVYGTLDVGVSITNNGAARAANNVLLSSSTLSASRIGFLGIEDLGGDLKAKFLLEAGFDVDTGAVKTYSGNYSSATPTATGGAPVTGLFNRRSFVGLEGKLGSVTLGRDYTPLYWAALESDPMRMGLYGNMQETVQLSGTGSERYGRSSNAIFYESPRVNGFKGRAMYGLGSESAGGAGTPPSEANRMLAISGQYDVAGLTVSAALQQTRLPVVAGNPAAFTGAIWKRADVLAGFNYTFSSYSVAGGYLRVKQPTPNAEGRDVWLGGTARLGVGTVLLALHHMRMKPAVGTEQLANIVGLGYVYPLSKRTSLYATYGQVDNSANATFALTSGDSSVAAGAAGAIVKAMAVGIRHNF
jgi:predicted porin